MARPAGRPSIAPRIIEYMRGVDFGTPTTIAEGIGAHPTGIARPLKTLVSEGILAQDKITRTYYLAHNDEGVPQRLGLVAAA